MDHKGADMSKINGTGERREHNSMDDDEASTRIAEGYANGMKQSLIHIGAKVVLEAFSSGVEIPEG